MTDYTAPSGPERKDILHLKFAMEKRAVKTSEYQAHELAGTSAAARFWVAHGGWIPAPWGGPGGRFVVWAEGASDSPRPGEGRGSRPRPVRARQAQKVTLKQRHPRAASQDEWLKRLIVPVDTVLEQTLWLPTGEASGEPRPSHPLLVETPAGESEDTPSINRAPDEKTVLAPWAVPCAALRIRDILLWLLSLPDAAALQARQLLLGDDLTLWVRAAELAREILLTEQVLPALRQAPQGNGWEARWEVLFEAPSIAEKAAALADALPPAALAFAVGPKTGLSALAPAALLRDFLDAVVNAEIRRALQGMPIESPARTAPDAWLAALGAPSPAVVLPGRENPQTMETLAESLASWRRRLEVSCGGGLRVCLRLAEPSDSAIPWVLDYLLQATADLSLLIPAREIWEDSLGARRLASLAQTSPQEKLLAALAMAGRSFPPIEKSLKKNSRPASCPLNAAEAYQFLREAAPLLRESGFGIFLPPWWRSSAAPKLGVHMKLRPRSSDPNGSGMEAWLDLDWGLALGDQALDARELEELARLKIPLVQLRGQWVEVDPESLQKAAAFWDNQKRKGLTLAEVFRHLRDLRSPAGSLGVSELKAEGWLKDLFDASAKGSSFEVLETPKGLSGTLRPYQEKGYSWLSFLQTYGFGACLADDMGLGKTIQSLTFLLSEKEKGRLKKPALLLCPTSVVGNWLKETARFAPSLRVLVHHGARRRKSARGFRGKALQHDLVVSTYALARRDVKLLSALEWSGVLLDEAQNIKNPLAQQTRAVRSLKGGFRIALTGTPVENRLSELWSIMEFLNPGYLGGFDEFERGLATRIQQWKDERASATLRRMVQPFILRRLKTDPTIITDLPEKMEMKVTCTLTREQATLYRAVGKDMLEDIESAEGISRRGLVLAALTKLKQVANHPAQFLKDGSALSGRSGKLERLTEMLEEVLEAEDSALIFTQYFEMGELLRRHLQATLLQEALFLHGGVSMNKRDEMVERFQAGQARLFILTVKAGGTGLNLTRASHVFHYDRWWNPAVENQATDRAFRIGQTKKVQVHKFLCAGTLEERIDRMIESKKALAENVLGSGESWLTELSNQELRKIFELREDALEVEA